MERHADILDQAEQFRERELQSLINNRKQYSSGIKPNGECHQCGYLFDNEKQLFCDSKCSLAWSRENER